MKTLSLPGFPRPLSRFCLGTADWGTKVDVPGACQLAEAFLAAGGNFIDTAHVYAAWVPDGSGISERTLAKVLQQIGANDFMIATKGAHPSFGSYERPDSYMSPECVLQDLAESLERLQTDHVALYYLHRDDPRVPVGEILAALEEQRQAGRIGQIGASNWSLTRLREGRQWASDQKVPGFVMSQIQAALADPPWEMVGDPTNRFLDAEARAFYTETQLTVAAYTPNAAGFFGEGSPRTKAYDRPENHARRERAIELAEKRGVTASQIALAWLLNQPFPCVPVFSTSKVDRLNEILAADKIVLAEEELDWLKNG